MADPYDSGRHIEPDPHLGSDTGILYRILSIPFFIIPIIPFILRPLCRLLILPATFFYGTDGEDYAANGIELDDYEKKDVTLKRKTIVTHDGAELDTVEIRKKNSQKKADDESYIVEFCGNAGKYQDLRYQLIEDAEELDVVTVGFNYRGVSTSTGLPKTMGDLVVDGIAVVQNLLDKGVQPEHILLKAHSMGGGIATRVAAHFHEHGIKVNLFNNRSFSTISNVVVGMIRTRGQDTGHKESFFGKVLGYLVKPFLVFFLKISGWEIEAADAWKKIPDENKTYIVARSSKSDREKNPNVHDDAVITDYGSLYRAIKQKLPKIHPERVKQKASKFTYLYDPGQNPEERSNMHNTDLHEMKSRGNQGGTAHRFFVEFAKNTIKKDDPAVQASPKFKSQT